MKNITDCTILPGDVGAPGRVAWAVREGRGSSEGETVGRACLLGLDRRPGRASEGVGVGPEPGRDGPETRKEFGFGLGRSGYP